MSSMDTSRASAGSASSRDQKSARGGAATTEWHTPTAWMYHILYTSANERYSSSNKKVAKSSSSSSRTYRLTWHKLNTVASKTRYTNYKEKN